MDSVDISVVVCIAVATALFALRGSIPLSADVLGVVIILLVMFSLLYWVAMRAVFE